MKLRSGRWWCTLLAISMVAVSPIFTFDLRAQTNDSEKASAVIERLVIDYLRAWEEDDRAFLRRAVSPSAGQVFLGWSEGHPLDAPWSTVYGTKLGADGTSGTVEVVCCARSEDTLYLQCFTFGVAKEEGNWLLHEFRAGPSVQLIPKGGDSSADARVFPELTFGKPYEEARVPVATLMDSFFGQNWKHSLREGLACTTAWPENHNVSTTGTTEEDRRLLYDFVGLHQRAKMFWHWSKDKTLISTPDEFAVKGAVYLHGGGDLCVALYEAHVSKLRGRWLVDKVTWLQAVPLRPPKNWREKLGIGDVPIAFPTDSPKFGGLPIFLRLGEPGKEKRQNDSSQMRE